MLKHITTSTQFLNVAKIPGFNCRASTDSVRNHRFCLKASSNNAYGSWDFDEHADMDASSRVRYQLLEAASQLMKHVHYKNVEYLELADTKDPNYYHSIASSAIEQAEATGAVPPLSSSQREIFIAALEQVARQYPQSFDTLSDAEDPCHWFDAIDGGGGDDIVDMAMLKPEFSTLLNELSLLSLPNSSWAYNNEDNLGRINDRIVQGGYVGNISVPELMSGRKQPKSSHRDQANPTQTVFAEGATERTALKAEKDYMAMEAHAFEAQTEEVGSGDGGWSLHTGGVKGDAPSAGGGLQVVDQDDDERTTHHGRPPATDF